MVPEAHAGLAMGSRQEWVAEIILLSLQSSQDKIVISLHAIPTVQGPQSSFAHPDNARITPERTTRQPIRTPPRANLVVTNHYQTLDRDPSLALDLESYFVRRQLGSDSLNPYRCSKTSQCQIRLGLPVAMHYRSAHQVVVSSSHLGSLSTLLFRIPAGFLFRRSMLWPYNLARSKRESCPLGQQ